MQLYLIKCCDLSFIERYKKGVRTALKGQLDSFSWSTGHDCLLIALGFLTNNCCYFNNYRC